MPPHRSIVYCSAGGLVQRTLLVFRSPPTRPIHVICLCYTSSVSSLVTRPLFSLRFAISNMACKHKCTFIPKAGEEIPRGMPTEVVTPRHRHVEYLSPRKTAAFKHFEAMPLPPPELTALAPSTAMSRSALECNSFPLTEPDGMDVVPEIEVPLDSNEDSGDRLTAKANNMIVSRPSDQRELYSCVKL